MTDVLKFENLTEQDFAAISATAQGWRPQVGSELSGRVVGASIGSGVIGDPYPIVFVLPDDATNSIDAVAVHCFHTVLKNKMMELKPDVGDRIYIRYMGDLGREAKTKGMSAPHIYAVMAGEKQTLNVWGKLAGPVQGVNQTDNPAETITWDEITGEVK